MNTINETCACGATFATTAVSSAVADYSATQWRKEHKHAETVGICANQPPELAWPKSVDRITPPRPHCALKAGHAGAHSDGDGSHWTEVTA